MTSRAAAEASFASLSSNHVVPGPLRFTPHPINDRAWWDPVATDARWQAWRHEILARADQVARLPTVLSCSALLGVRRRNDRSAGDRYVEEARGDLAVLIIRRCLLGPDDDDQLLDWLWAQATEPSWLHMTHWNMHQGNTTPDLPRLGEPDLDLMGCEQAAFLAEAVEVLGPWLATQSAALGSNILHEVDRRVLTPYAAGAAAWWDGSRINNWAGVCGGSILAACRSFSAQGRPRPQAEARAMSALHRYLDAGFTPDGECAEGIGYWHYGMVMAQLGITRLDPAEIPAAERLTRVGDFPRRCHLGGGIFLSWNDSNHLAKAATAFVPWLARQTGNQWLWSWARQSPVWGNRHIGGLLREAEALAWLAPDPGVEVAGGFDPWLEDQQVATFSSGRLTAAITGGRNDESHNHNDLGHVVVLLDRSFVLPDMGAPKPYPADFFGPRRYTYLDASSRGHSVPIIGGHEQSAGMLAMARLLHRDGSSCTFDLTAAYPSDIGLSRFTRTLACRDDSCEIIDHFQGGPGTTIEHVLWTAVPAFRGLEVQVSPTAPAQQRPINPAEHGLCHWDHLAAHAWFFALPASGELTIRTRLAPMGGKP